MMMDTALVNPINPMLPMGSINFEQINPNPSPGLDKYLENMFKSSSFEQPPHSQGDVVSDGGSNASTTGAQADSNRGG